MKTGDVDFDVPAEVVFDKFFLHEIAPSHLSVPFSERKLLCTVYT